MRWGGARGRTRGSKYGNNPIRCNEGIFHHSTKEARRCNELHVLQAGGLVSELQAHPQPKLDIIVNGVDICDYRPDFFYVENGRKVYEDVKGMKTDIYRLKKLLVLALHEVDIRET